jgi:hypothetical protein
MNEPAPPGQWLGHGPGCHCYHCDPASRRATGSGRKAVIIAVIITLAAIWAFYKIESNEAVKNSPPAACQLLGGHWSIWDGWSCY